MTRTILAVSTGAAVFLGAAPAGDGIDRTLAAVSAPRIAARIQFLAGDLLEGRGTGARGSEIAARYIAAEFAEDGLEPGGDAGTYLQNFEMVGVSADPSSRPLSTRRRAGSSSRTARTRSFRPAINSPRRRSTPRCSSWGTASPRRRCAGTTTATSTPAGSS
jgi:hypothetical protein